MGFDEGRIVLDSANGAYYPGQTLHGRLEFDQDDVKTFRGIYATIKGFCKVHWTTSNTRCVVDRIDHYTANHDSYEEYLNRKVFLAGGESGKHQIQAGHHTFPFQFPIPPYCPSSFEGTHGHVRYQVKIVVDRAFKFDQEKLATFRVVAPLDLNTLPYCTKPMEFDITNTYYCCCMGAGATHTLVKMPVAGYCPGQVMPIVVSCKNESTVKVDTIKFALKKSIIFHATREPGTRGDTDVIAEIKKGPIPANSTRNWTVEMVVPTMDVYNMITCRFIDVDYHFSVSVEASACHTDEVQSRRIMIGNIPIRGFQDNVPNPLKDQLPTQPLVTQNIQGVTSTYPPPPIVTQPMGGGYPGAPLPQVSPYPVSPVSYPGGNPPYPGGNPPHPGGNPPYPGANPPYPGGNPPHPGGNPPYPGGNPPYPGANPPYPGGNPPYPGANPPYPGGNPPYPGGNPPYPGANPPYPGGNPPYPGGNPPYPGANPPYPAAGGPASNASPPPGVQPHLSPYPGGDRPHFNTPQGRTSPYPATSSPYPASANSVPYPGNPGLNPNVPTDSKPLLKTGNLGFGVPVNPNNMVLALPPGSNNQPS